MNISGSQIRQAPFKYWEYIPTEVKTFFRAYSGYISGESSGKSTLVNKLANIFNTTSAWNMAVIMSSHLEETKWHCSILIMIKSFLGHAQYIDFAVKYANKVAFIDTDFVTTQAFCLRYEGKEHPLYRH